MFDFDLLGDPDVLSEPETQDTTPSPAPQPSPPVEKPQQDETVSAVPPPVQTPAAPVPAPKSIVEKRRPEAKAAPGTGGPCATCGVFCREQADDGKRYCDKCWSSWTGEDKDGAPVLLGKAGKIWQVIGGRSGGGVKVRAEEGAAEEGGEALDRLSTGALVRALENDAGRLKYELLSGSGPKSGWVDAAELKEKPGWMSTQEVRQKCGYQERLAQPKPKEAADEAAEPATEQEPEEAAEGEAEANEGERLDSAGVVKLYSERLAQRVAGGPDPQQQKEQAQAEQASSIIFNRKQFPWPGQPGSAPRKGLGKGNGKGSGKGKIQFPFHHPLATLPKPVPGLAPAPGRLAATKDIARSVMLPSGKKLNLSIPRPSLQNSDGSSAMPPSFDGSLAPAAERDSRSELRRELALGSSAARREARLGRRDWAEDSDGERMVLCHHCHLPVGDVAYASSDGKGSLHGECMAEHMRQELIQEEVARRKKDAATKKAQHEEHDIGWRASRIPGNVAASRKLGCNPLLQGMCCLILKDNKVRVVPTVEPAAAVNLEYLTLALRVRTRERREPLFSLDPVDKPSDDPKAGWQVKRFEPRWLAGTSAGDVLFQSDYHLKELSMGEYEQPVVGMKSCFEYSEQEECDKEWSAREWFVVRQADVHLTEDDVLLPYLRMGVEAREQTRGSQGREDARITRPNHPLVKYAEAFTRNFDLIAERKSAVFHLRELAKASVLAKFLVEARVSLDEALLRLDEPPEPACCLEVPQLWNDRFYSKIRVKDGAIVGAEEGISTNGWALYGGVQFGLDRFRLGGGPAAAISAVGPGLARAGVRTAGFSMSRMSAGTARMSIGAMAPKGVDLSLDKFGLSAARRVQRTDRWGSVGHEEACAAVGSAFWAAIGEASESPFNREEKDLFRSVFNPHLSDRREDGDLFTPPDTSVMYLNRLRALVREEERVRGQRKEHFGSGTFTAGSAGALFPSSWTDSFEVAQGRAVGKPSRATSGGSSLLYVRPDFLAEAQMFDHLLKSATPSFDRTTEDGTRFRIYKYGNLEVRTTQEPGSPESLCAILSPRPPPGQEAPSSAPGRGWPPQPRERLARAALMVERAVVEAPSRPGAMMPTEPRWHYYTVLTTVVGGSILTEKRADGTVAWIENPVDLEDRNALAKVVRSKDCHTVGVTVEDMKNHLAKSQTGYGAPSSMRKRYARRVYDMACGEATDADSGYPRSHWLAPRVAGVAR